jgi:hypothetical protein
MNSRTVGLQVAAVVFALVSLAQLLRLVTGADVLVADHSLPLWASGVAFVIACGLSYWMFKLSRSGTG